MTKIFHEFDLTEEQERKGRRILRAFVSNRYFGKYIIEEYDEDVPPLLVRIVATYMDKYDLLEEAEKMIEWCKSQERKDKRRSSILRFNNWMLRKAERGSRDMSLSSDVSKDFERVKEFIKKRNGDSKK